jgi:hypothetical protein
LMSQAIFALSLPAIVPTRPRENERRQRSRHAVSHLRVTAHDIGKLHIEPSISGSGRTSRVSVWLSFTAQPRLRPLVRLRHDTLRNSSSGWSSWKADCSNSPGRGPDCVLFARLCCIAPTLKSVWFHDFSRNDFRRPCRCPDHIWIALAFHCHVRAVAALVRVLCPVDHCARAWQCCRSCPGHTIWLALLVITLTWWVCCAPDRRCGRGHGSAAPPRSWATCCTCGTFATLQLPGVGRTGPCYEERSYDLAKLSSLDYFCRTGRDR